MVQVGAGRSDKRYKKTFEGDRYVLYLDCGDDYKCHNLSNGFALNMFSVLYANYASTKLK